jgi:serine/threonine-protein kinase
MVKPGEYIQGRYCVARLLGRGGFGAVYLAEDQRLRRQVAIKEMDASRLDDDELFAAANLFEREALMLAQLDHPNLTHIWDYFQQDGQAFLVMEYVPGQTLRELLIRRQGPLPEAFVIECALQLCDVLSYLHSRRPPLIFRDLKPGNVMVMTADAAHNHAPSPDIQELLARPQIKLIDFGIARLFKPDQTRDTMIIGTPGYAAPEQYGPHQTDERSDIYSLGATLHHLLSGQAPTGWLIPPLSQVAPHVSPGLARIVACATEPDPTRRYQQVSALRRDVETLHPALAVRYAAPVLWEAPAPRMPIEPPRMPIESPTLPPPPGRAPARPREGLPTLAILAVMLLVGVVALIAVVSRAPTQPVPPEDVVTVATSAPAPSATVQPATGEWVIPGATGQIVFGQQGMSDDIGYDLLVATPDGNIRRVTTDGVDLSPAWAVDGRLAFARVVTQNETTAIFVRDINTPQSVEIVAPDGYARYPRWSPDGRALAYAVAPNRFGRFRLAIVDLTTRDIRFPGPEGVAWLDWAQAGLIYAARLSSNAAQDLFVLDARGSPRNLTNTDEFEEEFPAWSPDGERVAYVASPSGGENLNQRHIYVMNADGSGRTRLTRNPGPHTNPVWSPDGQWIAYLSKETSADWQVWAMRANGSAARQITFSPEHKFYLAWGQ